jgi:hypothetical protein
MDNVNPYHDNDLYHVDRLCLEASGDSPQPQPHGQLSVKRCGLEAGAVRNSNASILVPLKVEGYVAYTWYPTVRPN